MKSERNVLDVQRMLHTTELANTINGGFTFTNFKVKKSVEALHVYVINKHIDPDSFTFSIFNRQLTIVALTGKRIDNLDIEVSYPLYLRSIELPSTVDADEADLSYKDGIFEVIFPLNGILTAEPKQLKVRYK